IGDNMSGTKLISLFGKISDALTANTLTESFRELKDNPITNPPNANTTDRRSLYKELMMVALMAGVGKSARNFTEYLPFEDYAPIINDALLNLENFPDIHKFAELDMFYKNNWH